MKRMNSLKSNDAENEAKEEEMKETTVGRSYLESQLNLDHRAQYDKD